MGIRYGSNVTLFRLLRSWSLMIDQINLGWGKVLFLWVLKLVRALQKLFDQLIVTTCNRSDRKITNQRIIHGIGVGLSRWSYWSRWSRRPGAPDASEKMSREAFLKYSQKLRKICLFHFVSHFVIPSEAPRTGRERPKHPRCPDTWRNWSWIAIRETVNINGWHLGHSPNDAQNLPGLSLS